MYVIIDAKHGTTRRRFRAKLLERMREERIEASGDGRIGLIARSALRTAGHTWFSVIPRRLSGEEPA